MTYRLDSSGVKAGKKIERSLIITALFVFSALQIHANVFLDEFDDLENWEPLIFPKIEQHSEYSLSDEGGVLEIRSSGGASGLLYKEDFNVFEAPVLRWKWKSDNVFRNGNALRKDGDDYPIRIYVIFEYDPEEAGAFKRAQYNLAKAIYGEYPPDSALNYVWANREWKKDSLENAYTDRAIMIASDVGADYLGQWREHTVNILEDYRKVFGKDPPARASLAIMGDSDNTGELGFASLDYIALDCP